MLQQLLMVPTLETPYVMGSVWWVEGVQEQQGLAEEQANLQQLEAVCTNPHLVPAETGPYITARRQG